LEPTSEEDDFISSSEEDVFVVKTELILDQLVKIY
jgi:hypothetical protein